MHAIYRIRSRVLVTVFFAVAGAFAPATAQDIYFGTLEREGDALVLRRCALGADRYLLRDAPGAEATPVASFIADSAVREGDWQVAVVGTYFEQGAGHGLEVMAFDDLRPGSCHLLDALEDAGAPSTP